jgi:DNA-binding MarR family transcriptional regulator
MDRKQFRCTTLEGCYTSYSLARDGPEKGPKEGARMATDNVTTADESLDVITDALLTASRLLMAISARSISQVDETITIPQFRTLVILSNRGPVNLATLAGLLGVQPSATGRMVDRLVAAGLIDRLPHPTSRRELLAALTKRGREVVRKVTAYRRAEIAAIVEKMPPTERHGLVRALTAFTAAGGEPDVHLDAEIDL